MKKIAILLLASAPVFTGFAQSSKVVNTINYLNDYNSTKDAESLQKAKENIDLASEHPDTKEKAKTQVWRGKVYLTIYEANRRAQEEKLMSIADPNKRAFAAYQNTPTAELNTAYQAFVKAKALDDKGNFTADLNAIVSIGINYDNTGRSNYNAKKYPEALTAFENAYEIGAEKDTTTLYFCASSAEMAKEFEKAKKYYLKMISNKQGMGATYSALMNVYSSMNDSVAAMDILKKGREAYPNDINLVISETNYFLKSNKSQEAINNLNIAINAKPIDYNLYLVRGNIYDNLANPKDAAGKDVEKPKDYAQKIQLAETDYKKAIELKVDYFDALYNLGVLYNNQGVELNKQADKITDQKKYEAANALATAQFANAMPVLEKALELNPKDRNTMIALKQIYMRMQMPDKVKAMNEKLKG